MRGFWIIFGLCLAGIPLQAQDIVKCGTPSVLEAMRRGKAMPDLYPSTQATVSVLSPSGKFRLEFETEGVHAVPLADLDENGIPDYIDRAGEYADESWRVMVDSLGYRNPVIADSPYLIRFRSGHVYGETRSVGSSTFILVHSTFIGFPTNDDPDGDQLGALKVSIAHELKHAIQYATNRWNGETGHVNWVEMDATMMEEVVYPQVNDYLHFARASNSLFSSTSKSVPNLYAAASFSLFYHERVGPHFWVDVWNVIGTNPQITMRDAISSQTGYLFEEYFTANHLWHHASGLRARADYGFADKAVLPTATSTHLASPIDVAVPNMPRLSARYYNYSPVVSDTGKVNLMGFRQNSAIYFGMLLYMKDGRTVESVPSYGPSNLVNQTHTMFHSDERFEDVDLIAIIVTNTGLTGTTGTTARFSVGPTAKISNISYGDVNLDGLTDSRDLTDLLAQLVGKFPPAASLSTTFRSDLTTDGTVTASDAAYLFQGRIPTDADAFGRGPGAARFTRTGPFEEAIWIDPDSPYYSLSPNMQVESVSDGDTIRVNLLTDSWVEARTGTLRERKQALILSEVKNHDLPLTAQMSDWMQDSTITRFVHVQSEASTGESSLTLSFRAVRKDTTVLVFQSGLFNEHGVYRTDSITIITNPKTPVGLEREPERPSQLSLDNYPNPFNPSTEIRYRKSEIGRVRLAVYDILGREVRILVNTSMPVGEHSIRFDAGNLSSGVYVLVLDTDGQRLVRSITLIK